MYMLLAERNLLDASRPCHLLNAKHSRFPVIRTIPDLRHASALIFTPTYSIESSVWRSCYLGNSLRLNQECVCSRMGRIQAVGPPQDVVFFNGWQLFVDRLDDGLLDDRDDSWSATDRFRLKRTFPMLGACAIVTLPRAADAAASWSSSYHA